MSAGSSGTKKKNQHWVPQFYLNAFAIPESKQSKNLQIYALPKWGGPDPKQFVSSIRNVASKSFLYSPLDDKGNRDYSQEDDNSELESLLSRVWAELQEKCIALVEGHRKGIALFIAHLYLRNIRQQSITKGISERLYAMVAQAFEDKSIDCLDFKMPGHASSFKFTRSEFEATSPRTEDDYKRMFVDRIASDTIVIAKDILDRRWNVLVSPDGNFVTSDNPVILNGPKHRPFGFASKDSTVLFPLTPDKLLFIDSKNGPQNTYTELRPAKGDVAPPEAGFNFQTYGNAYRLALGPRDMYGIMVDGLKFCDNLTISDPNSPYYALRTPDGGVVRLGRNDPCWCGSGKKYKRCHHQLERQLSDFNPDTDWIVSERRYLQYERENGQW